MTQMNFPQSPHSLFDIVTIARGAQLSRLGKALATLPSKVMALPQRFFLSGACRGRQKLIFPQQAILNPQKKTQKILRLRRS